ncbi:MAG TPA: phospholipase D-like domain-containing protein [Planktothrix sp.]|jgi:phosphatidylserine/phosphatidylglycerophosphate/cardiolipin synthase-like enzyme
MNVKYEYAGCDPHAVYINENFWDAFKNDLRSARESVQIFSPYIGEKRLKDISGLLKACIDRGVKICVFVECPDPNYPSNRERRKKLTLVKGGIERTGIHVTEIPDTHIKVAVIDDEIAWDGSLNILSQWETNERMTRWESRDKAAEIKKSHQLHLCETCLKNASA